MKNIVTLIVILPLLFHCNYSLAQKKTISAEVNFVEESAGTITVRSIGYGKNKVEAIDNAEINAMDVVLFRGVSESSQKDPLLTTNSGDIKAKNQEYFNNFYNGKQYKTFISSAIPTTKDMIKNKGGMKSIAVDMKINIKALKMNLEENSIIRKFGF